MRHSQSALTALTSHRAEPTPHVSNNHGLSVSHGCYPPQTLLFAQLTILRLA